MLEIYIYIDTYICIYIKKILTTKVVISFILKYKSKGEVSHSARESFIEIHLSPHETFRLASYYIWNSEFTIHRAWPTGRPTLLKRTRTDPTQDGTVCTERRGRGLARRPLPTLPAPASQKQNPDLTIALILREPSVWIKVASPEGWVFHSSLCVCFSLLNFFFIKKKDRKKKKAKILQY